MATSIAFLSNGSIEVDNKLLFGRDLEIFAKDEIAAYTKQLTLTKKYSKNTPEELLLLAINQLKNVKVKHLVQIDKEMSDPFISVVFPNNSRLMGKQWTLKLMNGATFSTQHLAVYRLSKAQMSNLREIVIKIQIMMINDHVIEILFDPKILDISIRFVTGILIFHTSSTYHATDIENKLFLKVGQQWEFTDKNHQSILPDLQSNKLVFL